MSAQAAHFTISDVLDVGIKIVMTVMTPVRVMNAKMHSAAGAANVVCTKSRIQPS
jgi:hypothetical protein